MIQHELTKTKLMTSIPRESGDDPTLAEEGGVNLRYSPRERG